MSKQDDQITGAKEDSAEFAPGRDVRTGSADALASGDSQTQSRAGGGARREDGDEGFVERVGRFLRDTRAELGRVAWPTTTEVRNTTIITLIAVIFFALYLYGVDHALAFLITQLERLVNWLVGAV